MSQYVKQVEKLIYFLKKIELYHKVRPLTPYETGS